jgi:beta-glucanase (GH16 family)
VGGLVRRVDHGVRRPGAEGRLITGHLWSDPALWAPELGGGGWGCGQAQEYTAANTSVSDAGHLLVTALPGPTSARLVTRERFAVRYGRVAASLKVPAGRGLWSAFWMLGEDIGEVGWPACGEIDVMEHVTSDPAAVHGTLHGPGYSGLAGGVGRRLDAGAPLSAAFHEYAVEWTPDRVTWLLDDVAYSTLTPADVPGPWPFRHPFHLLLNLAVGGDWPGLEPAAEATLPATLEVAWVRVDGR